MVIYYADVQETLDNPDNLVQEDYQGHEDEPAGSGVDVAR